MGGAVLVVFALAGAGLLGGGLGAVQIVRGRPFSAWRVLVALGVLMAAQAVLQASVRWTLAVTPSSWSQASTLALELQQQSALAGQGLALGLVGLCAALAGAVLLRSVSGGVRPLPWKSLVASGIFAVAPLAVGLWLDVSDLTIPVATAWLALSALGVLAVRSAPRGEEAELAVIGGVATAAGVVGAAGLARLTLVSKVVGAVSGISEEHRTQLSAGVLGEAAVWDVLGLVGLVGGLAIVARVLSLVWTGRARAGLAAGAVLLVGLELGVQRGMVADVVLLQAELQTAALADAPEVPVVSIVVGHADVVVPVLAVFVTAEHVRVGEQVIANGKLGPDQTQLQAALVRGVADDQSRVNTVGVAASVDAPLSHVMAVRRAVAATKRTSRIHWWIRDGQGQLIALSEDVGVREVRRHRGGRVSVVSRDAEAWFMVRNGAVVLGDRHMEHTLRCGADPCRVGEPATLEAFRVAMSRVVKAQCNVVGLRGVATDTWGDGAPLLAMAVHLDLSLNSGPDDPSIDDAPGGGAICLAAAGFAADPVEERPGDGEGSELLEKLLNGAGDLGLGFPSRGSVGPVGEE